MRLVRALTLTPVLSPAKAHVWIYSFQRYSEAWEWEHKQLRVITHRVPVFLSLQAHVAIENVLAEAWNLLFLRFDLRWWRIPYHIVAGLTSAHSMSEIVAFIKGCWRPDAQDAGDGCFSGGMSD